MLKETLKDIYTREIKKLKEELSLYDNEQSIWIVKDGILNSGGTLAIHLIGNLNHFLGSILNNNGYKRNREFEFLSTDIPLEKINQDIDNLILNIESCFSNLKDEDLFLDFPVKRHGITITTYFMLVHLLTHFNYHLGQINYHRRLTKKM